MSAYHAQRSIIIDAPIEQVFNTVADLNRWKSWSPWLCTDKNAVVTVSANSNSVGSLYQWSGEIVGQGEVEHKILEAPKLIDQELRFLKPFKATCRTNFEFRPSGSGAEVIWHIHGSMPWFLFWMCRQIEIFIGLDFERGLRMLKEYIETGSVLSNVDVLGVETTPKYNICGVRATCTFDEVSKSMENTFNQAKHELHKGGLPVDGLMASVYHKIDMKKMTFDYTSGFVVPGETRNVPSHLSQYVVPGVKALNVRHVGRYDHLGNAWNTAYQNARVKKLKLNKAFVPFEIYENSPENVSEGDLVTKIYLPTK